MESPENLERMAEERQQLEANARAGAAGVRGARRERVTQAAASGTRAEQNFEELRNEFRRRASGRFSEEMQQMREAARELDEREQAVWPAAVAEAASPQDKDKGKSLRDTGEREKIAEELSQQRQRLRGLEEQMRQTIEDAEQTEPLLAERLYDAARNAQDQNLERALEAAERSLGKGLTRGRPAAGAARRPRHQPAARRDRTAPPKRSWATRPKPSAAPARSCKICRRRAEPRDQPQSTANRQARQGEQQGQPTAARQVSSQPGQQQSDANSPAKASQAKQGANGQQAGEQQPGQGQQGQRSKRVSQGQKGQGQKGQKARTRSERPGQGAGPAKEQADKASKARAARRARQSRQGPTAAASRTGGQAQGSAQPGQRQQAAAGPARRR